MKKGGVCLEAQRDHLKSWSKSPLGAILLTSFIFSQPLPINDTLQQAELLAYLNRALEEVNKEASKKEAFRA